MKSTLAVLALSGTLAFYGCGNGGGNNEPEPQPPAPEPPEEPQRITPSADPAQIEYNDMAVHDPSILRDEDGTWYVFGSHLAAAKSGDLMAWERVAEGVDDTNPLFNTYASEIAEGLEWVGGHQGSWAADVTRLKDGRYYFYYNHCANPDHENGDCNMPRSYLGVAVSEQIEGPYTDLGIFLYSGMTPDEVAAGYGADGFDGSAYDARIHPNAIDPHTFYDKNDKLWMVYGSYSGGIFILEMDEATAKPKPGQGYGKHLAGGNHSAIEGSYMLYSPESDYYYLFMSFGGYVSTDGYNIRVARSRNPDGPFLDAEGRDMAGARGNWNSIEAYGVKLMGGFVFESHPGDPEAERGYLAPGHNSAYYLPGNGDGSAGKHLLITHTRFPNRGEEHSVRVHELFISADGWPLASPHRYAPIEGDTVVGAEHLAGDYKFIHHGKDINRSAKPTLYLTLNTDGSVDGEVSGHYQYHYSGDLALTLDGTEYRGVARWQWSETARELVPVFTTLSNKGEAVWGSRMPARSAAVLADIAADLSLPAVAKGGSLDLPTRGTRAASIAWNSGNPLAIDHSGRVTRPKVGAGDASATLTADIQLQGQQLSQTFSIQVPQRQPYNRSAQFLFEDDLAESLGNFAPGTATGDRIHNSGSVSFADGHSGRALQLDGASGVRLPRGLIDNYEYTVSFWANPQTLTPFTPVFFGALEQVDAGGAPGSDQWISLVPESWDGNTMLWSGSRAWFDGSAGERIPAGEWSHIAFAVNRGQVGVYLNGESKFTGGNLADFFTGTSGSFALGVNYWDIPFHGLIDELKIYDSALSAEEILFLDIDPRPSGELLASAAAQLDLGDLNALRHDLYLPASGAYASSLRWESSNPAVIAIAGNTGAVTRPAVDTQVTLTATLALDGEETTREFQATVIADGAPQPIAHYRFDQNLDETSSNFGAGSVTGNRIDQSGGNITFAAGVSGQAAVFDGGSGIRLPDNLITGNSYSFTLWLNPSALTSHTPGFFGWASTESWISLLPNGFGADTMLWSGTDWYDAHTGEQIPLDTWSHLAVVVNNGEAEVYINGERKFSGSNFPDVFGPAAVTHFALGVNYWDAPYAGMMDELRIYGQALGSEDVVQVFEAELLGGGE